MKIGIITICKVNNYGAELQAFATQKKLEQMGHNAEIINYLYYKNWHFKDTPLSQPFVPLLLPTHWTGLTDLPHSLFPPQGGTGSGVNTRVNGISSHKLPTPTGRVLCGQ